MDDDQSPTSPNREENPHSFLEKRIILHKTLVSKRNEEENHYLKHDKKIHLKKKIARRKNLPQFSEPSSPQDKKKQNGSPKFSKFRSFIDNSDSPPNQKIKMELEIEKTQMEVEEEEEEETKKEEERVREGEEIQNGGRSEGKILLIGTREQERKMMERGRKEEDIRMEGKRIERRGGGDGEKRMIEGGCGMDDMEDGKKEKEDVRIAEVGVTDRSEEERREEEVMNKEEQGEEEGRREEEIRKKEEEERRKGCFARLKELDFCSGSDVKLLRRRSGYFREHAFKGLIFGTEVSENTFRRHLMIIYRGLLYANNCLKGPSENYIRSKEIELLPKRIEGI